MYSIDLHEQDFISDFQLDAVPKREASIQRRMECQKEVDALKISFEKQVCICGWTHH